MARQTLTRRVEVLEKNAEPLVTLPDRVAALEAAMREGFDAVRAEMRAGDDALRAEMREGFEAVRVEMRAGDGTLRAELRAEMREGDEETRRLMRVLHEDVIERIARLGEAGNGPRRRRKT